MNLKKQTFSAIRWTSVAMIGKAMLGLLQLAILARELSPSDFGLMAIAVAIIGFAQIFSDAGLSNAIIHHHDISQKQLSSLYWLNVSAGTVLMVLLIAISSPVARFYQEPALKYLLVGVSFTFLLNSLSQQLIVIAEKKLQFMMVAKIELAASFAGVSVVAIWLYFSPTVIALAAGLLSSSFTILILSWLFLAKGWRPLFRFDLTETYRFLSFGSYTMADNFISTFNRQADIFIGGRMLSIEALGVYSLPRNISLRIASVVNPIVTRVGFPVMAKAKYDITFLRHVYLKTLRMTASINFPLYLAVAVFAPEIIILLFGEPWQKSIPLLRIFALWGAVRSIGNPISSILYATGRADLSFKWNAMLFFIVLPVIWFASKWGSIGIALALLYTGVAFYIPAWFFLVRPLCHAKLSEYTLNLLIPFVASIIAAGIAYLSIYLILEPIVRLILGVVIGGIVYLLVSFLINRQWIDAMKELLFSWRQ